MAALTLDRAHTTLLIADFYAAILPTLPHAVDRQVVAKTQQLQRAARDAGLLPCYCATVFRPGYIEISDRNDSRRSRGPERQRLTLEPWTVAAAYLGDAFCNA